MSGALKYSVSEVGTRETRVYYQVTADGIERPGRIFIYASEKSDKVERLLAHWCRLNAGRLATGNVLRADLTNITSTEQ